MPFAANIAVAVEQEVIVAAIMIPFLYIHPSDVAYTNARSIEAEQRFCFIKTMTPEIGLQNLRAYET